MVKKVAIGEHFKTVQTPIRLAIFTNTNFFAVFHANLLNEDEILVIIGAKFVENHMIFDQNALFYIILTGLVSDQHRLFRSRNC